FFSSRRRHTRSDRDWSSDVCSSDLEFNKLLGIDGVDAREIGGTRVMDKSHGWQAWEDIFAIKQAIEASGYKTRKDIEGVIQALRSEERRVGKEGRRQWSPRHQTK